MSSNYGKFRIHYDSNYGETETQDIYVKYNNSTDYQTWVDENGEDIVLRGTDSYIHVLSFLLFGKKIDHEYFYWEKIDETEYNFPSKVKQEFKLI